MRELEKLLQASGVERLIEIAPAIILVLDTRGRILFYNGFFERLTGVPLDEARNGDWFSTFLPESDHEQIRTLFRQVVGGARVVGYVNAIVTRSGEERHIEWSGTVLTRDAGDTVGVLSVGIDVTDRQQLERRARAQAQLVDEVSDAIISTDLEGRVESWNRAAEQIYGYTAKEVHGRRVGDLLATTYANTTREGALARVRSDDRWGGRVTQRKKDGSRVHIQAQVAITHDETGEARGMVAVNRDISAQVRAEQRLRESERRYRAIFQQHHQLAGVLSLDGRVISMNQRALDLAGVELDEVLQRPFFETVWWSHSPELQQRLRDAIVSAAGGERVRFEAEHPRADGSIAIVDFSLRPVFDETGHVELLIPEAIDITEQRLLEQQLAERERLATIGTVASMFAHEIGNPLNNMSLQGQLIARQLQRNEARSDVVKSLNLLLDEVHRLGDLLREFRNFGKRLHLELEPVDMTALIDEVLQLHVVPDEQSRIDVEVRMLEDLPTVEASGGKIKQVLINICKNAVEAMPEGGTLSVETAYSDEAVFVRVTDTGHGISADMDVFQPFESTKETGTGLGMAIARQIVKAHGGNLGYESTLGEGTTFTLELPRRPPEESAPAPPVDAR